MPRGEKKERVQGALGVVWLPWRVRNLPGRSMLTAPGPTGSFLMFPGAVDYYQNRVSWGSDSCVPPERSRSHPRGPLCLDLQGAPLTSDRPVEQQLVRARSRIIGSAGFYQRLG